MTMMLIPPSSAPPAIVRRRDDSTTGPTHLAIRAPEHQAIATTVSRVEEALIANILAEVQRRVHSFNQMVSQIGELFEDPANFDEDYLPPTSRSINASFDFLGGVSSEIEIPQGSVYPNGEGGLRMEWRSGTSGGSERYLLLSVHPDDERQDYIYYQQGSLRGEMQTEITASELKQRLLWLSDGFQ